MSAYLNLKQAIESFDNDSSQKEQLKKIDEAFQNIVVGNQSDLIKSLNLIEDFLVKTLDDKNLKKLKEVA